MDRLDGIVAGLFAATAMFRADAAVLMHARVLLAFLRTACARNGAGLQRRHNYRLVTASAASTEGARRQANVGAVKVEPDALPQLGNHFLRHTSISA